MQQLFGTIARVAATSATVLITGESGSGKEVVAQAIHGASPRSHKAFVPVNCAALPESLIENELFGHERGAFTGASDRQIGRIEAAHGGTLFLDEIGELPTSMQAKLLRVLEEHRLRRLGGKSDIEVDARIIAATNRSPEKAIAEGKLRQDLFYRLNVFHFRLPALRDRKEDIPTLAAALLESLSRRLGRRASSLDDRVLQRLIDYDWPGNVRELRNVLERALILAGDREIDVCDLPGNLRPKSPAPSPPMVPDPRHPHVVLPVGVSLRAAERALIEATMAQTDGNRQKTARILGLSLKTIHMKLKQYRADQSESTG
jgi:DNA-binding NtrC family response regulator